MPETTWDGLPIADDHPRGAGVVLRRPAGAEAEFLLLHRHHNGPDFEGDWAWTSPSGARLPGEPILTGALRELNEETGLAGVELRPVDLSGGWAVFAAQVSPTAQIVIDPEHDRYEWLPPDKATARLAPQSVADNFRKGSAMRLPDIAFRPLTRDDLPDMVRWQNAPHADFFAEQGLDLAAAERKYGPRIDGDSPVRVDVVLVDDRPAGFLQSYLTASFPSYADESGEPDAVAIDYLLGEPGIVGRGLGTQAIWAHVRDVVLPAHPAAMRVVASPDVRNLASIRALEKAGFQRLRDAPITSGDHIETQAVCVLDRTRVFG